MGTELDDTGPEDQETLESSPNPSDTIDWFVTTLLTVPALAEKKADGGRL